MDDSSVAYTRLEATTEAGETPTPPSAPVLPEPSRRYPRIDDLENKVLIELKELKRIIQNQQQYAPVAVTPVRCPPPKEFLSALEAKDWNVAAKMLEAGAVTVVNKQALMVMFSAGIKLFKPMDPEQLVLWKVMLKKTKITPDHLAAIKCGIIPQPTALQILLIQGDADTLEWIKTKATEQAFRKGIASNVGCFSLVAWAADYHNVAALKLLYELKYPQSGLRVFPVTHTSDWVWKSFFSEVKSNRHPEYQNQASREQCYAFWGEFIAQHL